MRPPLLAEQSVTLTHCLRKGTESQLYATRLTGVSCQEISSAKPDSPGFAPSGHTALCIFPLHSQAAPAQAPERARSAGSSYLTPSDFKTLDPALRAAHWTLAPGDQIQLPSGRTGVVVGIQDNRTGRLPHWYVEVSA